MNSTKTFAVSTIGIAEGERKVLRNIFKLSLYRNRSYHLTESAADGGTEILLVDVADAEAKRQSDRFRQRHADISCVLVADQDTDETAQYQMRRPFVASRVLGALDQVAINGRQLAPDRVIGDEGAPHSSGEVSQSSPTQSATTAKHVALVVDDSAPVRKQLEIELDMLGVSADFAESGEQAFEMLDRSSYDIVFLDVVLPGVDGYKICKTLKKNATTKNTPVVMLTSKSSPFDRVRGTFAGCDTYLTKPVKPNSFKQVVKKYLG